MKTPIKYILSIAAITAALTLSAKADFIQATAPFGGDFLFNDVAHDDVNTFKSFVGANNPSAPQVTIDTIQNVSSGSGFANIKPAMGNNTLTDLIFTPDDNTLFGDFSFRGQLTAAGNGTVTAIVTDQNGNTSTIVFTGLGQNNDFARQGVIAVAGSGETIASVELISDFKEVKQIRFSLAGAQVPDGGATVMLLGAGLGALGIVRRFLKS